MRLISIKIHNMMAHPEFFHEFLQPITIFAGPNEAGKTTIRDAIAVAWAGNTRGIAKNMRSKLARGPEGFEVIAATNVNGGEMDFRSNVTSDSPSPGDRAKWLGSKDLVYHLTDYRAWETVGRDKRHKLLNSILPQEAWRGTALPSDLEEIRTRKGIHATLTAANEQRRGMNRMLADFKGQVPPDPKISIDGMGVVDIRTHSQETVGRNLVDLTKKAQRITKTMMKAVVLTEEGDKKETELQKIVDKIPALEKAKNEAIDRRMPLNDAATKAGETLNKVSAKRDAAYAADQRAKLTMKSSEKSKCGTCFQEINEEYRGKIAKAAKVTAKAYKDLTTDYEAAKVDWDEANACAARAKRDEIESGVLLRDAKQSEKELEDWRKQIQDAKDAGLDYEDANTELRLVHTSIDQFKAIESGIHQWEWQNEQHAKGEKNIARMRGNVAEMEKICGTIEDNVKTGSRDVLSICDKHIQSLGDAFGREFRLDADYMPGMDGIPFQLLCESNQYLALIAIQYAIARVSGFGFIFIDSLDRLVPSRNATLRKWLAETVVPAEVQVVSAIARDNPEERLLPPFHVVPLTGGINGPKAKLD
jgi:DNA repair exonuclease SbcCD ATPase subunit